MTFLIDVIKIVKGSAHNVPICRFVNPAHFSHGLTKPVETDTNLLTWMGLAGSVSMYSDDGFQTWRPRFTSLVSSTPFNVVDLFDR